MKRIHRMLESDHQFRKQIEGLLMHEPVAIEFDKEVDYSSFVTLFKANAEYQVRVALLRRHSFTLLGI